MNAGMGNLLETDSDVASISDGEKERTDGDGMESETPLDVNKSAGAMQGPSSVGDALQYTKEPDKTSDKCLITAHSSSNTTINQASSVFSSVSAGNDLRHAGNISAAETFTNSLDASASAVGVGNLLVSPRELPPRNQLIQLKPTMCKPKTNSRSSADTSTEGISKQKNPRFIPYEPYRGAVRPIIAQEEKIKKHSRTASEVSASSSSIEHVIGNFTLNLDEMSECSAVEHANENTQRKSQDLRQPRTVHALKAVDAQYMKQEKAAEKQTHALTFLKERLKIAEKDNDYLHRENMKLKKLLVDSLSGDILHGRSDVNSDNIGGISVNDSVDNLSSEIEVWRSKFLSSCVLVEQLTRENGALNESVGTAANILKDIKLYSSLSPTHFEKVNIWLKTNRPTYSSEVDVEDDKVGDS